MGGIVRMASLGLDNISTRITQDPRKQLYEVILLCDTLTEQNTSTNTPFPSSTCSSSTKPQLAVLGSTSARFCGQQVDVAALKGGPIPTQCLVSTRPLFPVPPPRTVHHTPAALAPLPCCSAATAWNLGTKAEPVGFWLCRLRYPDTAA